MAEDIKLMKGNEAIAHAAIRYGVDGYFGYPITPQSEILETLMAEMPWEKTGMVVLQAESEVAAINMVYGGAGSGKKVMTSSSSPGVSLKQEGISYIAGAELPCLIVNVMRGGPGLGTIQPSQADYFQTVKGGGRCGYRRRISALRCYTVGEHNQNLFVGGCRIEQFQSFGKGIFVIGPSVGLQSLHCLVKVVHRCYQLCVLSCSMWRSTFRRISGRWMPASVMRWKKAALTEVKFCVQKPSITMWIWDFSISKI